ncbi:MjaI family restriction endonuclease [Flavobacterium sp. CS20]|uniref:MjaI family restriction endonuclease n=1 Tax=Flavobacterium sp. CS20 TaxID=2775246 RepID=UPI001B3A6E20|nr:MjaI family restriction endonuclease [Flavobacterium sp. CS20]QTY25948.1 MjaI family restriction endonuclease [Flavobacterium sp. CS20]
MSTNQPIKHAKPFGKKEKVLNYASNTYQLTRPKKVGAVMALIRECQPTALDEWEQYYFENAYSKSKTNPVKITQEVLDELGERLYAKITEVVIPEWTAAFKDLSLEDCKEYIYQVTIVRTYDGFLLEKSVVNDGLAKTFPEVEFEESDEELDHAGDIDYIGKVGDKAFGIQIKPITANSNFANYNISERMNNSFKNFEDKFGGKVFIIFSTRVGNKKNIVNKDILKEIKIEIQRLKR